MSDFNVVKCKRCDAPLIELAGQKLNHCIQCGYNFSSKTHNRRKYLSQDDSSTINTSTSINKSITSSSAVSEDLSQQKTPLAELKDVINNLKGIKTSKKTTSSVEGTKKKKKPYIAKKKKGFSIGTLIFYIVAFNVLRNLFW